MRFISLAILFLLLWPAAAPACFGPKLYLGTGSEPQDEVLYALISLYVKEKTGTETVRVSLEGRDPARELREEKVDLALLPAGAFETLLLQVPGWPALGAGPRPLNDLQFTTVPAALKKLGARLTPAHLDGLLQKVRGGAPAAAAVRRFLSERGWI